MDIQKLLEAISELVNAKIDASEAIEKGNQTDIRRTVWRNERATAALGEGLQLFVKQEVERVLATREQNNRA